MTDFDWTPERVDRLTSLWNDGLSIREIGDMLGCGKNAAVSKAHRVGLPQRQNPVKRGYIRKTPDEGQRAETRRQQLKHEQREKVKVGKTITPYAIRPGFAGPIPAWVSGCQWIEADLRELRRTAGSMSAYLDLLKGAKCGHERVSGRPYCLEHCARAYTRREPEAAKNLHAASGAEAA